MHCEFTFVLDIILLTDKFINSKERHLIIIIKVLSFIIRHCIYNIKCDFEINFLRKNPELHYGIKGIKIQQSIISLFLFSALLSLSTKNRNRNTS